MARDISISISAKDDFSKVFKTIMDTNKAFDKDLTGVSKKLEQLNKTKYSLKLDVEKSKAELEELKKKALETKEEIDKTNYVNKATQHAALERNFDLVSNSVKEVEKAFHNLTLATQPEELFKALGSKGLTKMVGTAVQNYTTTYLNSALGSENGTMLTNILSSAVSGAAMGAPLGPHGIVAGAVIGGVAGAISGSTENFKKEDEAFKKYYQNQYNSILDERKRTLESGLSIASTREQDKLPFATLLGGDTEAEGFLNRLEDFAKKGIFNYEDLTAVSKTLLTMNYNAEELIPLLESVGEAGSALGMKKEDMTAIARTLGQMQATGKMTMDSLSPLLKYNIPVWEYLAEKYQKTKEEIMEMVNNGQINGEEASNIISEAMATNFKGSMEKQQQTYIGLLNTMNEVQNQINSAMGEGYMEVREKGMQEQIDFMSGETGTQMEEAYRKIGQWQASLENLAEEYERDALSAVMTGEISDIFEDDNVRYRLKQLYEAYSKLSAEESEKAVAKMGELLAEAQAIAQNEYNASEGAQLALKSNLDLAERIKNDAGLKDSYWNAGYEMGVQFSKGLASVIKYIDPATVYYNNRYGSASPYSPNPSKPHAYGLNYVPYDNYPVLLHEGERVLTAAENRAYKKSDSVVVTGNTFVVREEADISKIAVEIVKEFSKASFSLQTQLMA